MGPGVLADIARDLVKSLRRDVTTDWVSRDDVRAKLRSIIKRLLARYGYRPTPSPAPPNWSCARWKLSPRSGRQKPGGS
jgi:type I restriction enzyme R subunit